MGPKSGRYTVLFLCSVFSFLLGAAWCPFSTIPREAADYYDVSEMAIDAFELSFMVMYVVTAVPSTYLLHASLRWSILTGMTLLSVGAGVRYIAGHSFVWALVGQIIIASANCLALASCSTVAQLWFPPDELVMAIAVASLSNGVGEGVQLLISPCIGDIPINIGSFALVCVCMLGLNCLLFKDDPMHPPTSVAKNDICDYLKDCNPMRFLLFTGSAYGIVCAYLGMIFQLLKPPGYSGIKAGLSGLALTSSGMAGGLSSSFILSRCSNYSTALQGYLALALFGSIALCFAVLSFTSLLVISCFYGFGVIGFIPLAIRAALDEAPRIDPSVPSNIVFFATQVFSLLYSYPALLFSIFTGFSGLYLLALFTVLSLGPFLILYKARLNQDAESKPLLTPEKT